MDLELPQVLMPRSEFLTNPNHLGIGTIGDSYVYWVQRSSHYANGEANIGVMPALSSQLRKILSASEEIPPYQFVLELPSGLTVDPQSPITYSEIKSGVESMNNEGLFSNLRRFITICNLSEPANRGSGLLLNLVHRTLGQYVPNSIINTPAECIEFIEENP